MLISINRENCYPRESGDLSTLAKIPASAGMTKEKGFTLIELSIVLVIIGLIIGGILVGQDLIKAAEVRAQLSQIEKYNSAVNTFRGKFGGIPGDLEVSTANKFGFSGTACPGNQSYRDGNGLIEGYITPYTLSTGSNEPMLFWQDISSSVAGNLIDGQFPNSGGTSTGCGSVPASLSTTPGSTFVGDYFPAGKIGHGTYVYAYSLSGYNWYGLSQVTGLSVPVSNVLLSNTGISVIQAYNLDKKMDDGLPLTGVVQATYVNSISAPPITATPSASTDSAATCYNTTNNVYSIGSLANYGANGNCALSFRFQ